MGMDPATATVLSSVILGGLGFAGGALQGDPQQMETFANGKETDPNNLIASVLQTLKGAYGDASKRAESPIELPSSYVQDVPTFTGGGLPMPIGVSGHDPALKNPELKRMDSSGQIGGFNPTTAGSVFKGIDLLGGGEGDGQPISDFQGNDVGTSRLPGYRSVGASGVTGGISRRPLPSPQDTQDPDGFNQAQGAIDLLMHALGG